METTIRVEKLKKSYGNITVINNIDISIKSGEVFGLLGANGAGTSNYLFTVFVGFSCFNYSDC